MFTLSKSISTYIRNLKSPHKEKMSSADDDLTTDACPTPPRDDQSENSDGDDPQIKADDRDGRKEKTEFSGSFPQTSTGPTATAYATVINISNSNGIHVGSNYKVYVNKPNKSPKNKKTIPVTGSMKKLFASLKPVTKQHIQLVATHMNENWRDTVRLLNYSDGQISQFYEKYIPTGVKEVIYQLLLDWIQNEPDSATVGRLCTTLWDSNQQDVVKRWSQSNTTI